MGSASRRARHTPKRMAAKLLRIRRTLGLSQNDLIRSMGSPEKITQSNISGYERGVREPPLLILLEYARIAGVSMETLVDDAIDLPAKLPSQRKHVSEKRKPAFKGLGEAIHKKRGGRR